MSDGRTNFPKQSQAQRTGSVGVTIVTRLVEDELKWNFRRNHQEDDFGIDGYVDIVRSDGAMIGKSFAVQIKTGSSHVAKTSDQGFLLYGEIKHLNYFLNFSVPVILVWVDDSKKQAWWIHVTPHAIRMTKTGWSILIPKTNRFDSSSSNLLLKLAGPTKDYLPLVDELNKIRNIACQAGFIIFRISKDEAIAGDISRLQEFFKMFEAAPDVLPSMRNKLVLAVHGYNEDKREVFEIPEVSNWYSKAEKAVLGWTYYLDLNPNYTTFQVFLACTCGAKIEGQSKDGSKKFVYMSPESQAAFLTRHYCWLNEFTDKHGISLEINKEISNAMVKAFVFKEA